MLFVLPRPALAVITFTQLNDDTFVVSHRVKGFGNRGQAMRLVYEKAASLCVAAGYSHFKLLDQESTASGYYEAANASVRVQFFWEDGDERMGCEENASSTYVGEARTKLASDGYVVPHRTATAEATSPDQAHACPASCTLEQIAAMARAGLLDEQIRAACP